MGELAIHHPLIHLYLITLGALCVVHIYGFIHQAHATDILSATQSSETVPGTKTQAEQTSAANSTNGREFHDVTP
jgi:hypothetical protein